MPPHSVDASTATFDQIVLKGSKAVPVIVDFWAPWCAPCRALAPILERLADEYGGKFVLAKVNSDENQTLAAEWGVRGIPNVKAFADGRLVDEFSGALTESAVRDFIERLMPTPGEELRRAAMEDFSAGDAAGALRKLDEAATLDPRNRLLPVDRVEVLIALGQFDKARAALDGLDVFAREEDRVKALTARLNIASGVAGAPPVAALEARLAADADDLEARLQLAHLHAAQQRHEAALAQLLEIVRRGRDSRGDAAREQMIALFGMLGSGDELVRRYRRLLAAALH